MLTLAENREKYTDVEFATNKILVVLSLAVGLSLVLMLLNYAYQNISTFMPAYIASKVLTFASLGGIGFGIYRYCRERRQEPRPRRYFSGALIAIGSFVVGLLFFMMAYTNYVSAVKFMYIVIAAVAVLYVIYSLYQPEFFVIALTGAVDALYIWRVASANAGTLAFYIFTALAVLIVAAVIAVAAISAKNGLVRLGGNRYRFFRPDTEYIPFIAALGLILALTLAVFFLPAGWIVYAAYAILALIFCAAVYYTVKMI